MRRSSKYSAHSTKYARILFLTPQDAQRFGITCRNLKKKLQNTRTLAAQFASYQEIIKEACKRSSDCKT